MVPWSAILGGQVSLVKSRSALITATEEAFARTEFVSATRVSPELLVIKSPAPMNVIILMVSAETMESVSAKPDSWVMTAE